MNCNEEIDALLADMQDLLEGLYPDTTALNAALMNSVNSAPDIGQTYKDAFAAYLANEEMPGFHFTPPGIADGMADFVKDVALDLTSHEAVNLAAKAQKAWSETLAMMAAQGASLQVASNATFAHFLEEGLFSSVAKVANYAQLPITMTLSVQKIWDAPNPSSEELKQGLVTLASYAAETFATKYLAHIAALGATSGGIAAIGVGVLAGTILETIYDNIVNNVAAAKALGLTLAQATEQILSGYGDAIEGFFDATGPIGQQYAQDAADNMGPLIDDMRELSNCGLGLLDDLQKDATDLLNGLLLTMQQASGGSVDPLVLDLNANGVSLQTLMGSSAHFNLQDRGFKTQNGWVTGGDGLLAIDANNNGLIDNVTELFGSATQTGFQELATLDTNSDGKITSADSAWNTFKVWVDVDSDGVTDTGELKTLAELNITEIGLTTTASNTNINGNTLVETANFVMNGSNRTIGEVLFQLNPMNSMYGGAVDLSWDAIALPDVRGYGLVADTVIAMSLDASLLTLGQGLETNASLASFDTFRAGIGAFLFKWAEVESVDPQSRGAIDYYPVSNAQELAFLEKFTGYNFITPAGTSDPLYYTSWERVSSLFHEATEMFALRFLAQSDASLSTVLRYDMGTDEIVFTTANTADLTAAAPVNANEAALYWTILAHVPHSDTSASLAMHEFVLDQMASTGIDLTAAQADFFNVDIGTSADDPYLDGIDKYRSDIVIGNGGVDGVNYFVIDQGLHHGRGGHSTHLGLLGRIHL